MTAPSRQDLQLLLAEALAEPVGLLLQVSDPTFARAKLYEAKRAMLDPDMDRLQLRVVQFPEGNLAIVKGKPKEPKPDV